MAEQTDKEKAAEILARHSYLKKIRLPFEAMVDKILEFVRAARPISETTKGTSLTSNVYDGTPLSALNIWADGMYGYICSPNLDWFSLTLPNTLQYPRSSGMRSWSGKRIDDVPEVAEWLNDCEDVLNSAFLRSNFYAVMPQFFRDGGSIGTAAMDCEEDLRSGRIFFTPLHFREFTIAEDMTGMVDTIYRRYQVSLKNLVARFGQERVFTLDPTIKQRISSSPYEEVYLIHAVQPRTGSNGSTGRVDRKSMPFASYWLLEGKNTALLDEGGYKQFPSVVWRYRKETDEIYGRSPAWDAYSEIMLGNQEARSNLIAGQKSIEPPMIGLSDLKGLVNRNPGGWTWVENMLDAPQPLHEGINLPFALEMRERTDKAIEKHFNIDFFLMLSQAAYNKVFLTATQVIQMAGEKAAILATRTDTLNIEALNPIIDRVFDIEYGAGRIPPPPDILADLPGAHIEVDYLGPLAQAQKVMFRTQGIRASMEDLMLLNQINPEAMDVFNATAAAKEILKANRVPASVINSQEQVDALRAMRKHQMEMEQMIGSGTEIAKALPAAGAEVSENSPLGALMNAGGDQ